jgi:histone H4
MARKVIKSRIAARTNKKDISDAATGRIFRRAGVKRMSEPAKQALKSAIIGFLAETLATSVVATDSGKRKTITSGDVKFALARHGNVLLG